MNDGEGKKRPLDPPGNGTNWESLVEEVSEKGLGTVVWESAGTRVSAETGKTGSLVLPGGSTRVVI